MSMLRSRDEYFASTCSWSAVLSRAAVVEALSTADEVVVFWGRGRLTAGRAATEVWALREEVMPRAAPVRTATCCLRRLYCFVKSCARR